MILSFNIETKFFILKDCKSDKENTIPLREGFSRDPKSKVWFTPNHKKANSLRAYADTSAIKEIDSKIIQVTPWENSLLYDSSKLKLKDYQEEAVRWILSRNRSYAALDAGLGKTPCAIVAANTVNAAYVYICPPFLCLNVKDEIEKWNDDVLDSPRIVDTTLWIPNEGRVASVLIVPDSMLDRKEVLRSIKAFCLYWTRKGREVVLYADEAHRFKNPETTRTMMLFGFRKKKLIFSGIVSWFKRVTLLSGTPMPNRPIELYPMISKLAPESIDFADEFEYGRKFCNGKKKTHSAGISQARRICQSFQTVLKKNLC